MLFKVFILIAIISVAYVDGEAPCERENEIRWVHGCMPMEENNCNFHGQIMLKCVTGGCTCKPGYKYNKDRRCVPVGPDCT
ncbi:hypothetical protein OSTOST_10274 [Ostertagia ostertagi]